MNDRLWPIKVVQESVVDDRSEIFGFRADARICPGNPESLLEIVTADTLEVSVVVLRHKFHSIRAESSGQKNSVQAKKVNL